MDPVFLIETYAWYDLEVQVAQPTMDSAEIQLRILQSYQAQLPKAGPAVPYARSSSTADLGNKGSPRSSSLLKETPSPAPKAVPKQKPFGRGRGRA